MVNKLSAAALLGLALAGPGASHVHAQATKAALAHVAGPIASTAEPGTGAATTAEARANALTASMSQGLKLTPVQTEKVRTINANSVRGVEAARLRFRQEPGKLRSYIDDISTARLDQLKDVLTPTQFARYQQKREQKMGIPTVTGSQGTPPPGLGSGRGDDN